MQRWSYYKSFREQHIKMQLGFTDYDITLVHCFVHAMLHMLIIEKFELSILWKNMELSGLVAISYWFDTIFCKY